MKNAEGNWLLDMQHFLRQHKELWSFCSVPGIYLIQEIQRRPLEDFSQAKGPVKERDK